MKYEDKNEYENINENALKLPCRDDSVAWIRHETRHKLPQSIPIYYMQTFMHVYNIFLCYFLRKIHHSHMFSSYIKRWYE